MVDLGYWSDFALKTFVDLNPSPQWASRQIEPYRGLPFGTYLHATRPRRQRRLTGPLPPAGDSGWPQIPFWSSNEPVQYTDEQVDCGFLTKLPYDVRLIIYEMALGQHVFHLSAQNPRCRITKYICNRPEKLDDEGSNHSCEDADYGRPSSASRERNITATGLLPLLVSCRKIYSEAINTLYGANTFIFTQNFAAFTFLKSMVPPQRLPFLRRFRLHMRIPRHPSLNSRATRDWQDLWAFFGSETTGLQSLYIELQMLQPTEAHIESTPDEAAESWIKPMVIMAVNANRSRGCNVELETRHVRHHPAQIFTEIAREQTDVYEEELIRLTCTALHNRIRVSLV